MKRLFLLAGALLLAGASPAHAIVPVASGQATQVADGAIESFAAFSDLGCADGEAIGWSSGSLAWQCTPAGSGDVTSGQLADELTALTSTYAPKPEFDTFVSDANSSTNTLRTDTDANTTQLTAVAAATTTQQGDIDSRLLRSGDRVDGHFAVRSDSMTVQSEAIAGARGILNEFYAESNFGPLIAGQKYRGSIAAPTSVGDSDRGLDVYARYYDGTALRTSGGISFIVCGSTDTAVIPGCIVFKTTTTNNPAAGAERMRVAANGNVGIGTPDPLALLDVSGDIAVLGTVDGVDLATLESDVNTSTGATAAQLTQVAVDTTAIAAVHAGDLALTVSSFNAVAVSTAALEASKVDRAGDTVTGTLAAFKLRVGTGTTIADSTHTILGTLHLQNEYRDTTVDLGITGNGFAGASIKTNNLGRLQMIGSENGFSSDIGGPAITIVRQGGAQDAPTALDASREAALLYGGNDGSGFSFGAAVTMESAETFGGGAAGSTLKFYTAPLGGTVLSGASYTGLALSLSPDNTADFQGDVTMNQGFFYESKTIAEFEVFSSTPGYRFQCSDCALPFVVVVATSSDFDAFRNTETQAGVE